MNEVFCQHGLVRKQVCYTPPTVEIHMPKLSYDGGVNNLPVNRRND